MNKLLVSTALLLSLISFRIQAQSTASGSSNTGNATTGSTPAQNGSTGPTVSGNSVDKSTGSSSRKNSSTGVGQTKSSATTKQSSSKTTIGNGRRMKNGKVSQSGPTSSTNK
ncbi:hypothetical protein [Spirosoma pulveris]